MHFPQLTLFLSGAICMGEFAVALLFAAFWRRTHDRLFAWFSAAFAVLTIERIVLLAFTAGDVHPMIYTVRLVSFLLIIGAVIDRNRRTQG